MIRKIAASLAALTATMFLVLSGSVPAHARAHAWSANRNDTDCSVNACIYITYNEDLNGVGMRLNSVRIYKNGGIGTVGHQIRCWNENQVVKWEKVGSPLTDLGGPEGDSKTWYPADVWPDATEIHCRYTFDAVLFTGDINDQWAQANGS